MSLGSGAHCLYILNLLRQIYTVSSRHVPRDNKNSPDPPIQLGSAAGGMPCRFGSIPGGILWENPSSVPR